MISEIRNSRGDKSAKRGMRGFCHFCHPHTLGIRKIMLLGKGAKRRMFQRKDDLG